MGAKESDKNNSIKVVMPAAVVLEALAGIVQAGERYYRAREVEETHRVAIKSKAEVEIVAIKEQANIIRDYLRMEFEERKNNFESFLEILDKGIESSNDTQINAALNMIGGLMQQSPMKNAALLIEKSKDRTQDEIIDI